MSVAPITIRLYRRPIGVTIPETPMPQSSELVQMPPCLLCGRTSHYTPDTVGFLTAGDPVMKEKIFIICLDCSDSDEALKEKIAAKVSGDAPTPAKVDISQPPMAEVEAIPAKQGAWAKRAAHDWVKPLADRAPAA